jgi:hypothetical protein
MVKATAKPRKNLGKNAKKPSPESDLPYLKPGFTLGPFKVTPIRRLDKYLNPTKLVGEKIKKKPSPGSDLPYLKPGFTLGPFKVTPIRRLDKYLDPTKTQGEGGSSLL